MEGLPNQGSNFGRKIEKIKRKVVLVGGLAMATPSAPEPISKEASPVVAPYVETELNPEQVLDKEKRIIRTLIERAARSESGKEIKEKTPTSSRKNKKKTSKRKTSIPKELKGNRASMDEQLRESKRANYDRLPRASKVVEYKRKGRLVGLSGNKNYELRGVSYPYARPEVKLFVERLSKQYREACGEKLVITSLTRPINEQPRNASKKSVHPAGMSVDFRISHRIECQNFLEQVMVQLERSNVIEATKEKNPPHYHVAVFPRYKSYVARKINN